MQFYCDCKLEEFPFESDCFNYADNVIHKLKKFEKQVQSK